MSELMGSAELDQSAVDQWRTLIAATGAVELIEQMIAERVAAALELLSSDRIDHGVRDALATWPWHARSGGMMRTVVAQLTTSWWWGWLAGLSALCIWRSRPRGHRGRARRRSGGGRPQRRRRLPPGHGPTVLTMRRSSTMSLRPWASRPRTGWSCARCVRLTGRCSPTAKASMCTATRRDDRRDPAVRRPDQAHGYRRLRTGSPGCIGSSSTVSSPPTSTRHCRWSPPAGAAGRHRGFRRWDTMVGRFITDERLRRVFTFQALYAGSLRSAR
ncbi:hypothetical protein I553_2818, partial [Mycobacterium xenopi 4042]